VSGETDLHRALAAIDAWDHDDTGTYADLAKQFAQAFADVRRDALAPVHQLADELEAVAETLDVTGDHTIAALTRPIAKRIREAAGGAE
jgi:hypothetical protein